MYPKVLRTESRIRPGFGGIQAWKDEKAERRKGRKEDPRRRVPLKLVGVIFVPGLLLRERERKKNK